MLSFGKFEANGYRILVVAGRISHGDGERLNAYLRSTDGVDEIWLDSGGGDASEGMEIGRAIRRHKLATRVPNNFECVSSCTFAFMGGVLRRIELGATYGVHMFFDNSLGDRVLEIQRKKYPGLSKAEADLHREREMKDFLHEMEQGDAKLAAAWQVYTQEMGISRRFLSEQVLPQLSLKFEVYRDGTVDVGRVDFRCLSQAQLAEYNIVNTQ